MSTPLERPDLRADCARCEGLCCVVPGFTASADFAIDKPSGVPCPHLSGVDFSCTIHTELPERGFHGCTVYDCFGAGQRVVQQRYAGRDWRRDPGVREEMFADFEVVERLHELLWYLLDALDRPAARPLLDEIEGLRDAVEAAATAPRDVEVVRLQLRADALLGEVSALVRGGGVDLRGRDLVARDLRGETLDGANLRGAVLVGADLRGAQLGEADLLGADLRAADLRGADLREVLFSTRFQVRAARTDDETRLPSWAAG